MSQCCTLSNPSSDPAQLLNQTSMLLNVAGSLRCQPANDHVCNMSICVELGTLDQSIKNLPSSFCFKVVVAESLIPETDWKGPHVTPELDIISKAIMEQYGIDDNTVVSVIDTTEPSLTAPEFIRNAAKMLNLDSEEQPNIIVFTLGHKIVPKEWSEKMDNTCTLLQYINPEQILKILSHCKNHVLTGNLMGWWGAILSNTTSCVCPDPWTVSANTRSFTINQKWKRIDRKWQHSRYFDHVYYINLDRRTDRRDHMNEQLDRHGLEATRISALDGKTIPWKPEYGVLSNYWNNSAFAYCLSYRLVIIDAIQNKYENILIMDDDCFLQDNVWDILDKAWTELPEDWHMLYLAANHGNPIPTSMPTEADRLGDHIYRLKGSIGSHAIIINNICFKTILNYLISPYAPLDMFFSMYQKFFPCFITYPGLATQMAGYSDIIDKDINYTKDWGMDYINHISSRNCASGKN